MDSTKVMFIFAVAFCIASATHVVPTGSDLSMQQLVKAMSQITIENTNLKNQLIGLQTVVSQLTSALDQTLQDKAQSNNSSLICEKKLNKAIDNTTKCSLIQLACNKARATALKDLSRCETTKGSLENDKIIHHNVLNASKSAHDDCLGQLASSKVQLANTRTQLGQCRQKGPVFPKTCQEWRAVGYRENGDYMVDPDGPGGVNRLQVECEMNSHTGWAVMIMHHDSETRMNAGPKNLEDPFTNIRKVVYKASIPQITAVIRNSYKCEQFIKYECSASFLSDHAAWYSRDGTQMLNWGGAPSGSRKCGCGMTNSCDKPGYKCNCDINDRTWRSDSGWLTDKNTLPVTKMAFGDLSGSEAGYHRLGPLRCYTT